jgi:hypothetical protein
MCCILLDDAAALANDDGTTWLPLEPAHDVSATQTKRESDRTVVQVMLVLSQLLAKSKPAWKRTSKYCPPASESTSLLRSFASDSLHHSSAYLRIVEEARAQHCPKSSFARIVYLGQFLDAARRCARPRDRRKYDASYRRISTFAWKSSEHILSIILCRPTTAGTIVSLRLSEPRPRAAILDRPWKR